MLWIKLGLRDLLKNKGFSFFFILNLALGLAGFIAIHSFGRSLDRHFDNNLKEILTADLVVSGSRNPAPKDFDLINRMLPKKHDHSRQITFYSMVRTRMQTKLARIEAIDNQYPLYGTFELEYHTPKKCASNPTGCLHVQRYRPCAGAGNRPG